MICQLLCLQVVRAATRAALRMSKEGEAKITQEVCALAAICEAACCPHGAS